MSVKQPLRWAFPVVTGWAPLDQMPNANASIINLTVSYKLALFVVPFYKWGNTFLRENVHRIPVLKVLFLIRSSQNRSTTPGIQYINLSYQVFRIHVEIVLMNVFIKCNLRCLHERNPDGNYYNLQSFTSFLNKGQFRMQTLSPNKNYVRNLSIWSSF